MINDDYTPMDFVIAVLMQVFGLPEATAEKVTMQIHNEGRGVCGVFPHEIAEAKVYKVEGIATVNKHPLLCIMEKDE
jgi:ATP-dependent Clp protease adaptor protein ClpS